MKPSPLLIAATTLACSTAFAGTAEVKFVDPARFTDLATSRAQEAETMNALASHLQRLAAGLPADQVLRVDVLDVDLAGYAHPTRRGNVRVNNGLSDAPMVYLRYTLEANGQPIKTGEERVTDLGYQDASGSWRSHGQFYYEKRLLTDWFGRTFGQSHAQR